MGKPGYADWMAGRAMTIAVTMKRRVVRPLLDLLRIGATPEKLAWSLAVGLAIGVNPLLGSTTVVALAVAGVFQLNLVASQLTNHLMYPVELLLFPVFLRLGSLLFRTEGLPMDMHAMFGAVKQHPWATTKLLWRWEWHALVVWAAFAGVAVPVLQMALRVPLRRMLRRLQDEPIVEK